MKTLTTEQAKEYIKNYSLANPNIYGIRVTKGLVIDRVQYDAMQEICEFYPTVDGFRIYYGIDNLDESVRIVTGIDSEGKDILFYIMTPTGTSGVCPPICDKTTLEL